jgi:hypothetical protein
MGDDQQRPPAREEARDRDQIAQPVIVQPPQAAIARALMPGPSPASRAGTP